MFYLNKCAENICWSVTKLPEEEQNTRKTTYFALGLVIGSVALKTLGILSLTQSLFISGLGTSLLLGNVFPIPLLTKGPYLLGCIALIAYTALKLKNTLIPQNTNLFKIPLEFKNKPDAEVRAILLDRVNQKYNEWFKVMSSIMEPGLTLQEVENRRKAAQTIRDSIHKICPVYDSAYHPKGAISAVQNLPIGNIFKYDPTYNRHSTWD